MDMEPVPGEPEPQDRPAAPPRWGLGEAAAGLFLGYLIASVLAGIWLGATGQDELSLAGQGFSQLGLWVGLLGAPLYAARRKGSGLAADFGYRFRPIDAAVGLGIGLGVQFVVVPVVAFVLGPLLGHPDVSQPARELTEEATGIRLVLLVGAVVIATPIIEEIYFRGLLLRAVERRWGSATAVVVSSVVFGLVHVGQPNVRALALAMISLSIFAVILALVTLRTDRLGPAIVAHAVFNAWTLLVVLSINP